VIMTVEFSGAIRLYANRETYMWWHVESARKFTNDLINSGIPVYCITSSVESLTRVIATCRLRFIAYLPEPGGSVLYKIGKGM